MALVEANRVGWGASGRNGGQLHTGQRRDQDWLEAHLGKEAARRLWVLAEEAKAVTLGLIETHAIACDWRPGLIEAVHKERFTADEIAYVDKLRDGYGYDAVTWLDRAALTQAIGTDVYFGGRRDARAGHLDPLKFAQGLARAAAQAGARIHEGTRAEKLSGEAATGFSIATPSATLSADTVILAGNGYLAGIDREVEARVMPIDNYIVATAPIGAGAPGGLIPGGEAVSDTRFVVYYFRPSADGRLVFGGGETYGNHGRSHVARAGARPSRPHLSRPCRGAARACLGRHAGDHAQPPALYPPRAAGRLCRRRLFRPGRRHRAFRRQGAGRSDRRQSGQARHLRRAAGRRLSGRSASALSRAGRRHGLVPPARLAVSRPATSGSLPRDVGKGPTERPAVPMGASAMSETAEGTAAAPALVIDPRRRAVALWVILLAFGMDLLDSTIVNIGIPSIRRELGTSYAAIQWIVAGYQLTFALFLITGGRLGDIFGYRRMLLIGMSGFALTSALCGFAASSEMLVAARLLQGLSAALMVPQTLAIMQVMYPTVEERQRVSALYGAVAGIATVSGPIIGALLITGNPYGFGWRTIFLINLPFAVAAISLGFFYLPVRKSPHPLHVDIFGVGLILLAMLMLMFPLIEGRELDWPQWAFVSMAVSLAVFGLFAVSQVWKDRRDGSPLVVPHLFRARSFVGGITISLAFYAVVASFFLVLTIFLQIGIGYDVLTAGLTSIPFSLGIGITVTLAQGVLVPRFGRNTLTAGPLIMIVGFALFMAEIATYGGALSPWAVVPVLFVIGVGMGCVVAPIYPFILAQVPVADAGSASGVINAVGQVGGAVGVAAVGVIFFGLIGSQATVSVDSVRGPLTADLAAAGLPAAAVPEVVATFETCFRDRANAKDFADVPASCAAAEKAQAAFAASEPALAAKVGAIIARYARQASQRNFSAAMTRTLVWQVGGLVAVALLTFLLPMKPKRRDELAEAGAEP